MTGRLPHLSQSRFRLSSKRHNETHLFVVIIMEYLYILYIMKLRHSPQAKARQVVLTVIRLMYDYGMMMVMLLMMVLMLTTIVCC